MPIKVESIQPGFVIEIAGVDLTKPQTPADIEAIRVAIDDHGVAIIRDQSIDDDQQMAFSRRFGELELTQTIGSLSDKRSRAEIGDVTNLNKDNEVMAPDDRKLMFSLGNQLWHSDSSFKVLPAAYSLLSARVVPSEGGDTEFADMTAAYETLSDAIKAEIEDLICEHSLLFSRQTLGFTEFTDEERERFAPVRQRLVRPHPTTGRKSLFLSSHAGVVVGWPVPQGRALLRELLEHATQRERVYRHKWRPHDLVIWDNRQTMHRATPFRTTDKVRDLHRTTVAGSAPTAQQAA